MRVFLDMPEEMVRALSQIARQDDVTLGQLIRAAVAQDLRKRDKPKKDARTDEALVASLRSLLATDLADARDWSELDLRLAKHGFAMRPAGGGLVLARRGTGQKVCKASELGYAHGLLARRFGAAFPGHPHAHLFDRDDPLLEA